MQADDPIGTPRFPIVAIGASAGGLEACQQLLQALPKDTGMAYVLVQHLDPQQPSLMAEILARATPMSVTEVHDEPRIEPNHVYVMPPNRTMLINDGHLKLLPRAERQGSHRTIDSFFCSLAETQKHNAIGVVLSGTGTDGTLGLEAIKAEGGITFAQDETAPHDSMPRSAVAAGCVDFVLAPKEIASEATRIGQHLHTTLTDPLLAGASKGAHDESDLNKIIRLLQESTGVDFSQYKSTTLYRRITRRMLLHHCDGLHEYLLTLQDNAAELHQLYTDILISVTAFFRDPECFEMLKRHVLPRLWAGRAANEPLRMWVLGCSTGQEAYSLAMTIAEFAAGQEVRVPVQVFATDLNELGIETARAGLYSKNIVQDVSPERLRRFFLETDGGYQVSKAIREMCVFARQNVLTDPPFSRLDLISCRNLLIYMEPVLQKRLIPLLHYALKPGGFLWLGTAESVAGFGEFFEVTDARYRIYVKKAAPTPGIAPVPVVPASWQPRDLHRVRPGGTELGIGDVVQAADRVMVARYAPPGVLINGALEVQQFRGDTSPYLSQGPGKPTVNLLRMAREGLLVGLRSAVEEARAKNVRVRQEGLHVKTDGGFRIVNLEVLPVSGPGGARFLLVVFEDSDRDRSETATATTAAAPAFGPQETEEHIAHLTRELVATREFMQFLVEQQEAANEEMQSANEEIQSSNEELQSLNEELQTSKEEIQSSNEELTTVNEELRNRNQQLDRMHNDLNNFLASSALPMVMVDTALRIRRFSPAAEKLLKLIEADLGRPIEQLRFPLASPDLEGALAQVIASATPYEREVQDRDGRWYSLRLRPYENSDKKIDGAVILLVDIEEQKRAQEGIRAGQEKYRTLVHALPAAVYTCDAAGAVTLYNDAAVALWGRAPEVGSARWCGSVHIYRPDGTPLPLERCPMAVAIREGRSVRGEGIIIERPDGSRTPVMPYPEPIFDDAGRVVGAINMMVDLTDITRAEKALRDADRRKDEFLATLAHELRNPLAPLANTLGVLRQTGTDGAFATDGLAMMERQVQKLTRLVDDILDVARITKGTFALRLAPVDLVATVHQAVASVQHDIAEAHHELSLSLPAEPVWINGDSVRLEQVIANLLSNAEKYTDPNGSIALSLDVTRDEDGQSPQGAVLRVTDNGIGISAELRERIFELFARGDVSYARQRSGLGIGLSLVKSLVEMHGGSVTVHSEGVGHGSEFAVRLPLASGPQVRELPDDTKSVRQAQPQASPARHRILVVDDNVDAAESAAMLLELAGHEVRVSHSGAKGVDTAATFHPDVVLLDIGMPGMDGYEAARRMRQLPDLAQAMFVAVSGYGSDEDRRRSADAGFDLHLVKPADYGALLKMLQTAPPRR